MHAAGIAAERAADQQINAIASPDPAEASRIAPANLQLTRQDLKKHRRTSNPHAARNKPPLLLITVCMRD